MQAVERLTLSKLQGKSQRTHVQDKYYIHLHFKPSIVHMYITYIHSCSKTSKIAKTMVLFGFPLLIVRYAILGPCLAPHRSRLPAMYV